MIGQKLEKFAKDNELNIGKDWIFGVYNGYGIYVRNSMGKMDIHALFYAEDQPILDLEADMNKMDLKEMFQITKYKVEFSEVNAFLKDDTYDLLKVIAFLDWITNEFAERGFLGAGYCTECGRPFDPSEKIWWTDDILEIPVLAHKKCMEEYFVSDEDDEEEYDILVNKDVKDLLEESSPEKKNALFVKRVITVVIALILVFLYFKTK